MKKINNVQLVRDIPPPQKSENWVSLDLEIFGADENILHRPHTGEFGCLTFCSSEAPKTVYLLDREEAVGAAIGNIKDAVWVIQNAMFDITHLRRWSHIPPRRKLWDTMLIDKIMYGGYYDRFDLGALARRHLGVFVDKELQSAWADATELTEELIEYAVTDPVATLQVCQAQKKVVSKNDWKIWQGIELPALWAFLDFMGFPINVEQWESLAIKNKARSDAIDEVLGYNPRSYAVVKKKLVEAGFKGLPKTGAKILQKYIKKYPNTDAASQAESVLLGRKLSKRASTYGLNFIEKHVEKDLVHNVDVIHSSWNVIGASTSRTSSSNPNMQNIPVRDTLEFRECFLPRPGNKLVIVDYGQQEFRIAAFLSQDPKLIELFTQTEEDAFVRMVWMIYKKKVDKSDDLRKLSKDLVYGLTYGQSPHGFAEASGLSLEEAKEVQANIFATFPGLARWARKQAKYRNFVRTISGRKVYLNPYEDTGKGERNALNSPIQGSAAEMMKRALARTHQDWKWDYPFGGIAFVHDELVFDVPEGIAKEVAVFATKRMVEEGEKMCPGIPFKADAIIGDSWAAKG